MKKLLFLLFMIVSMKGMSQAKDYVLFGGKKTKKGGMVFGINAAYWPQDKLNKMLGGNNAAGIHYPTLNDMSPLMTIGSVVQKGLYRFSIGWEIVKKVSHNDEFSLSEKMNGGYINVQKAVYRTKKVGLSPEIGFGTMNKSLVILTNNYPVNLGTAMAYPAAVNLFSHAYHVDVAMNVGLGYDDEMMDHVLQLVVGYKYCFSGSDWSTNDYMHSMPNSEHDYLRMVYVGLKVNILKARK
jgi:hypothetical protein